MIADIQKQSSSIASIRALGCLFPQHGQKKSRSRTHPKFRRSKHFTTNELDHQDMLSREGMEAELRAFKNELREEREKSRAFYTNLTAEVANLTARVGNLTAETTDLSVDVTRLTTDNAKRQENITTLMADKENQQGLITALMTDNAKQEEKITTLQESITTLMADNAKRQENITTLQENIITLQEDITTLMTDEENQPGLITASTTDNAKLQETITQMETRSSLLILGEFGKRFRDFHDTSELSYAQRKTLKETVDDDKDVASHNADIHEALELWELDPENFLFQNDVPFPLSQVFPDYFGCSPDNAQRIRQNIEWGSKWCDLVNLRARVIDERDYNHYLQSLPRQWQLGNVVEHPEWPDLLASIDQKTRDLSACSGEAAFTEQWAKEFMNLLEKARKLSSVV